MAVKARAGLRMRALQKQRHRDNPRENTIFLSNISEVHTMISAYETYLSTPKSLNLDDMRSLHQTLISEIGNDSEAAEIYDELVETAVRYASFRASWFLWSREERLEKDPSRTACHNSVIVKLNMLARYLKMQGHSASWRDTLGYEEDDACNRKRIGDFACYLVFINSILAR